MRAEDDAGEGGRQEETALDAGDGQIAGGGAGDEADVDEFGDEREEAGAGDGEQEPVEYAVTCDVVSTPKCL